MTPTPNPEPLTAEQEVVLRSLPMENRTRRIEEYRHTEDVLISIGDEFEVWQYDSTAGLERTPTGDLLLATLDTARSQERAAIEQEQENGSLTAPEASEDETIDLTARMAERLHEAINIIGEWHAVPMGAAPPFDLTYRSAKLTLSATVALEAATRANREQGNATSDASATPSRGLKTDPSESENPAPGTPAE